MCCIKKIIKSYYTICSKYPANHPVKHKIRFITTQISNKIMEDMTNKTIQNNLKSMIITMVNLQNTKYSSDELLTCLNDKVLKKLENTIKIIQNDIDITYNPPTDTPPLLCGNCKGFLADEDETKDLLDGSRIHTDCKKAQSEDGKLYSFVSWINFIEDEKDLLIRHRKEESDCVEHSPPQMSESISGQTKQKTVKMTRNLDEKELVGRDNRIEE